MQHIVKLGLTKAGKSNTLHTTVKKGHHSLVGIGLFDPILIQGASKIVFLIKHFWKFSPYISLLRSNLSTLQLEADSGGRILANFYLKIQQMLQTDS